MVLPTQGGLDQLKYRTKAAKEFVSEIENTHPQYKEDQTIDTMLRKLKYAIQVASNIIKELEETVQNTNEDLEITSKEKISQELLPNARKTETHD